LTNLLHLFCSSDLNRDLQDYRSDFTPRQFSLEDSRFRLPTHSTPGQIAPNFPTKSHLIQTSHRKVPQYIRLFDLQPHP